MLRLVALASLLCAPQLAIAHHSFDGEFDRNKPVTLQGTITKVEWANPHGRFFVDVKDAAGTVTSWEIELGSINGYLRNGWTRTTLKPGDVVTVGAFLSRETPRVASTSQFGSITLPDGRRWAGGQFEPVAGK